MKKPTPFEMWVFIFVFCLSLQYSSTFVLPKSSMLAPPS
jgi:hypothetical protein